MLETDGARVDTGARNVEATAVVCLNAVEARLVTQPPYGRAKANGGKAWVIRECTDITGKRGLAAPSKGHRKYGVSDESCPPVKPISEHLADDIAGDKHGQESSDEDGFHTSIVPGSLRGKRST